MGSNILALYDLDRCYKCGEMPKLTLSHRIVWWAIPFKGERKQAVEHWAYSCSCTSTDQYPWSDCTWPSSKSDARKRWNGKSLSQALELERQKRG